jgi:hypothetical protein
MKRWITISIRSLAILTVISFFPDWLIIETKGWFSDGEDRLSWFQCLEMMQFFGEGDAVFALAIISFLVYSVFPLFMIFSEIDNRRFIFLVPLVSFITFRINLDKALDNVFVSIYKVMAPADYVAGFGFYIHIIITLAICILIFIRESIELPDWEV